MSRKKKQPADESSNQDHQEIPGTRKSNRKRKLPAEEPNHSDQEVTTDAKNRPQEDSDSQGSAVDQEESIKE